MFSSLVLSHLLHLLYLALVVDGRRLAVRHPQQANDPKRTIAMVQVDATPALALAPDHVDLPVGSAYRAIRSPRGERPALVVSPLANQDSIGSELGSKKTPLSPSGSCDSLDATATPGATLSSSTGGGMAKDDLAKRAQTRVTERKRTELEKKQEQEKQRMKKQESDKMKKDHDAQLKQRRRAEIYALNAILRQLQQEKMAAFIHAHKPTITSGSGNGDGDGDGGDGDNDANQPHHEQHQLEGFAAECSEASIVQSIGV